MPASRHTDGPRLALRVTESRLDRIEPRIAGKFGNGVAIDQTVIAQQTNLSRQINSPTRLPEPIVNAAYDKCFQPYVSVLRDPVQFPVDERNQSLEGTLVAPPPFEKEPGDSRRVCRNTPF
jgi:hypothetical protein